MKIREPDTVSVNAHTTIEETMGIINEAGLGIALVLNERQELLGTVTDGDIRRGLLGGIDLDEKVSRVMNEDPISESEKASREDLLEEMRSRSIQQLPLIDNQGKVSGLVLLRDLIEEGKTPELKNPAVVLAGGLGTRLRPMTHETPKPLLEVGNKPILEIIVGRLVSSGFKNIYLSVCYEAEQIKDHFGDGNDHGAQISYIEEDDLTGTAGPLRLLENEIEDSFLVMNGDLLTKVDFANFLDFHQDNDFSLTIGATKYEFEIPYGVIQFDDTRGKVEEVDEKPAQDFFVNGGIYALEPDVLQHLPEQGEFDMTDLINKLLGKELPVGTFPIHEYWLDIGEKDDYEKANGDYNKHFGESK